MKLVLKNKWNEFVEKYSSNSEPVSDVNWFTKAAVACEDVSDAVLREERGASSKIAKGVAGKLGAAGTSVGIFSIASLLGTASTGTAIGSLSGAAFTSAALAWVGGSVFMGSIILGVATIAGGIGAVMGAGWVYKNYLYGKKRETSELEQKEQNIIDACLSLAMAFHQQEKSGQPMDPNVAKAIYGDALKPLCDDLLDIQLKTNNWSYLAKQRLGSAIAQLKTITNWLRNWSEKNSNISIGIVSSVFLQLLSDDLPSFDGNEELVMDALRRSSLRLREATNEDIASYIQSQAPAQIAGLQNNVKGIYHELRFAKEENADNDEYLVELFEATNHPRADVLITNTLTGGIKEVQLKATDYLSYIKQHNQKYEDIGVFATDEVALEDASITSTGIRNKELNEDVAAVIEELDDYGEFGVASSMTVAAMISLAINVNVLLRGNKMTSNEKAKLVEGGMVAAGVAGLVSLLIG
ncbi:MAG: hypothetical protein H8E38_00045 [SAR324 cluster bacterium]|nr:hypothetical protein [SAR324 cluster bacterium]